MREQCFVGPGDRPDAQNVAVIVTDGIPFPPARYQPAIDLAEILRMENSEFMGFSVEILFIARSLSF